MPNWKVHRWFGRCLGIRLSDQAMRKVDRTLDYPTLLGVRLPHKSLHNVLGVMEAYRLYGPEGARYAMLHLILDRMFKGRRGKMLEALISY